MQNNYCNNTFTCIPATQDVILNSTLVDNRFTLDQQEVIFICVVWGSNILEWNSVEYIGQGSFPLQLLSFNNTDRNVSSTTRPSTYAVRLSVVNENGQTVIVSELRILASLQYPIATVTCSTDRVESIRNITFQTLTG